MKKYLGYWCNMGEDEARLVCGRDDVGYDQSEALASKDLKALTGWARTYEALDSRRNGPILDLGCGTGRLLMPMAREFAFRQIYGCDISKPAIELACARREKAGAGNVSLGLMSDPTTPCPYNKGFFSNIIMFDVLSSIPSEDIAVALLQQAKYCLSIDGILAANARMGEPIKPSGSRGLRFQSTDQIIDLFDRAGLKGVTLWHDSRATGTHRAHIFYKGMHR